MYNRRPCLLAMLLLPVVAACGDSTGPDVDCGRDDLPPCVAEISITAPSTRLLMSGTLQLTAVPRDAAGVDIASVEVRWQSSDSSVATVDAGGLVNGVAHGTADVIVSAGSHERVVTVHVVPRPVSCSASGTVATSVADSVLWRTADGPFHLAQTVVVDGRLLIESGALVCGASAALLQIGSTGGGMLRAHGSAGDTIVFTAVDPARPWAGIQAQYANEVDLRFVRIESALNGIDAAGAATATVEDARISRIGGVGIAVGRVGSISRTLVDSADTGISIDHGSAVDLREVVVRNAAGTGIRLWRSRVGLHDVRVEDSGGAGIAFDGFTGLGLTAAEDVVVTGSTGPGVSIAGSDVILSGCTITGGAAEGVLVGDGTGVAVHGCNVSDNAGAGVRNATSFFTVDASLNWWGDVGGPTGPAGDGVAGDVLVTPFLTEPVPPGDSASRALHH